MAIKVMNMLMYKNINRLFLYIIHKSIYTKNVNSLILYKGNITLYTDYQNEEKSLLLTEFAKAYRSLTEFQYFKPIINNETVTFENLLLKSYSRITFKHINDLDGLSTRGARFNNIISTIKLKNDYNEIYYNLVSTLTIDGKIIYI